MALSEEFVGCRIKNVREANHLTQNKFSEKMHITQQTLSRYENGKTAIPYKILEDISTQFSVPVSYFFGIDAENFSEEEFRLVEYYRKVDERLKSKVLDLVRVMAGEVSDE